MYAVVAINLNDGEHMIESFHESEAEANSKMKLMWVIGDEDTAYSVFRLY